MEAEHKVCSTEECVFRLNHKINILTAGKFTVNFTQKMIMKYTETQ